MDSQRPAAQVDIDEALARRLLREQVPDMATQPLSIVDEGWDNVTIRVGAEHALRLPRRDVAVELLLKEQRWLPVVAERLPVSVPELVHAGARSESFPYPWSLVTWVAGTTADLTPLEAEQGSAVAAVLRVLHRPAPEDAPTNPVRGVPLEARRAVVEARLAQMGMRELVPLWREGLDAPVAEEALWLHGDLHPRNAVVTAGRLTGLIDWGDMAGGDPATDLACAWMLFDSSRGRTAFLEAYGPSDAERVRARAWAVNFASALILSGDPKHERLGHAFAARLSGEGAEAGW